MVKRMSGFLAEKMVSLDKINNEEVEMYAYNTARSLFSTGLLGVVFLFLLSTIYFITQLENEMNMDNTAIKN